jgi:hypothetical protein
MTVGMIRLGLDGLALRRLVRPKGHLSLGLYRFGSTDGKLCHGSTLGDELHRKSVVP